jgi:putative peptide zinc metalloprotease protein
MNLTRVLDVSLPKLPPVQPKESYFRFNSQTIFRIHKEHDQTMVVALAPKTRSVFNFTAERWELVKLFDGRRSYPQVAALWRRKTGIGASPDAIRTFAEKLDESGFWYKTPQEESTALLEELRQGRAARAKGQASDLTKIYVFFFDADDLLTRAYKYIKWMYSPPFVIASVIAILLMFGLWIARSDEVWRDSILYWNMTQKTLLDVLEFYLMFAFVGFFHECGHAFTAKNFGAEVHRTGLMLVYTTPAFFVTTTEVWLHGRHHQRLFTILAGFWVEMMLCAVATFVWWGTAVGGAVHNLAYKLILVGGIMPLLLNMNPLMRLDGYLFLSGLIRMPWLKEQSTAFLTNWVQRHIFRLPVTVPILPRRRALFFAGFALLSGAYTYMVLLFLSRLTYRIFYNYTPEWAFLPAGLVALRIFKSRIEKFLAFLKTLYLDKKEFMLAHWKQLALPAAAAVALVFVPLWREEIQAPVLVEPNERAVLRAEVPGRIEDVLVNEGQAVAAGAPVVQLQDLDVDTESAQTAAQLRLASAAVTAAQLQYGDYAAAAVERQHWTERARLAADKRQRLFLNSPIAGTVVSPRMQDLRGSYVAEGTEIAEIQDVSRMRARIYVAEGDMRTLSEITSASLKLDSRLRGLTGQIASVSPTPQELPPGLLQTTKYKGLRPPQFYVLTVLLPKDATLRAGMTGEAKVFGKHRSLAWLVWQPVGEFLGRKIW